MTNDKLISWLLEESQPAVRYHTLTDLLDRSPRDPEVSEAYSQISDLGWAATILGSQSPGGYWESPKSLYRPKYVATNWRLLVLADLGVTAKNPLVKASCELFLQKYSKSDGGFGSPVRESSHFCVTGNLARTLIRCGYENEKSVRRSLGWLVEQQKSDGGWHCFESSTGTLDCWEALSAFSVLPRSKWSRSIKQSVERGAEFYLERHLYREGGRYAPWLRFHYPVHYYYDILVGLDILTSLGYVDDHRLDFARNLMQKKQNSDGTWNLDAVHPDIASGAKYELSESITPFYLEAVENPSKWITFLALRISKRMNQAALRI